MVADLPVMCTAALGPHDRAISVSDVRQICRPVSKDLSPDVARIGALLMTGTLRRTATAVLRGVPHAAYCLVAAPCQPTIRARSSRAQIGRNAEVKRSASR
jgi:hypothetical protein